MKAILLQEIVALLIPEKEYVLLPYVLRAELKPLDSFLIEQLLNSFGI
jgi:hypothetical protein